MFFGTREEYKYVHVVVVASKTEQLEIIPGIGDTEEEAKNNAYGHLFDGGWMKREIVKERTFPLHLWH